MTLKDLLIKFFKRRSISYIYNKIICIIKGKWCTFRYVTGPGQIVFRQRFIKLRIVKDPSAKILLNGDLILDSHLNLDGTISITLCANAQLIIDNNFNIGQNIGILLCENAILSIGGADKEEVSGITSDTKIMCYKKITIGKDFLCSWNVFITDCDWHAIYKNNLQVNSNAPVEIGNHVWIGSNVIINKSSVIGENVIIGAYSKIANTHIKSGSTIAGCPPKIISTTTTWKRSL